MDSGSQVGVSQVIDDELGFCSSEDEEVLKIPQAR